MKNHLRATFLFTLTVFLFACSAKVEKNSTQLTYDLNENSCATGEHSFESKNDYCQALTDESLNKGCALRLRRGLYEQQCGTDFQETNIIPLQVSGYDLQSEQECSVLPREDESFSRLEDYCRYLSDESRHGTCFWKRRHEEFERRACSGEFPPAPASKKQDQPAPRPAPKPTPDPQKTEPAVVQHLRAAGIEVEVRPDNGVPGERPFRERLAAFWPVLENSEQLLIDRASSIKKIRLTSYAIYDSEFQVWTLCVDFNQEELPAYIALNDRRLAWEKTAKMQLDTGIDAFGFKDGDKFLDLREKIEFLETNLEKISSISQSVRKLEWDSYLFYSWNSRTLKIPEKKYRGTILSSIDKLQGLNALHTWLDARNVTLNGSLDLEKSYAMLATQVEALNASYGALETLIQLEQLKEIDISDYSDAVHLYPHSQKLVLAARGSGTQLNTTMLEALSYQYALSNSWKLPIESRLDDNAHYLTTVQRLRAHEMALSSKKAALSRVLLSYDSEYSSQTLTIGYRDSEAHLKQIIDSIPTP